MGINHQLQNSFLHIGQKLSHIRRTRNEKLITDAKAVNKSHGIISRIEHGRYDSAAVGVRSPTASRRASRIYRQLRVNPPERVLMGSTKTDILKSTV